VKFIHVFTQELKNKLLQNGFELLVETNGLFIFKNNPTTKFNFTEQDKKQFVFSNKMTF
jgi:organic radical activating enzyme